MGNKLLDYEEQMRNRVQGPALKHRRDLCNGCNYKGANNFCQKNSQWLPDFQVFRYNACPIGIWVENWSK